jgi:hypothetical protein
MIVRHLAGAGDFPTIGMVLRVTDRALYNAARIVRLNQLEAKRAAVLFLAHQAHTGRLSRSSRGARFRFRRAAV